MSAIDTQNAKNIRDAMQIVVKVGESSNPYFEFDNSNLLSCELQLRSDLSAIDPTLPESEIVIRAYWPEDISEELITIADGTIITYQAGYAGDMSPVRTFYLAEKITWEQQVLTVHGVDAVHFMEAESDPLFIGNLGTANGPGAWGTAKHAHRMLTVMFMRVISDAGITPLSTPSLPQTYVSGTIDSKKVASLLERQSRREIIANMMNLCHQEYASNTFNGMSSFWLTYVDAGRPVITREKPSSSWTINEADCGDIKRYVDKNIVQINAKNKRLDVSAYRTDTGHPTVGPYTGNQKIGKADLLKSSGAAFSYDCPVGLIDIVLNRDVVPDGVAYNKHYITTTAHPNKRINPIDIYDTKASNKCGSVLRDSKNAAWQGWSDGQTETGSYYYLVDFWLNLVTYKYITDIDTTSITCDLYGSAYNAIDNPKTYTTTGSGIIAEPSKTYWAGEINAAKYSDTSSLVNILPDEGFKSLLKRSNETGSFTWKGDPRMQPRDVFTFVYKDGTEELRTIETINLKHEEGGTVATITYRKGIV